MPDKRRHRGPHPEDLSLFDQPHLSDLQSATRDLSWLLSRGYSTPGSVKLVGDRYALAARQRLAVQRSSCSDSSLTMRKATEVAVEELQNQNLDIDGFNLLTTIEAALAGGIIIVGRDGCYRDMASIHGTYRMVQESASALELIGEYLAGLQVADALWLLDAPVSNSGRLAAEMRAIAEQCQLKWQVELLSDPDSALRQSTNIVVSADSVILDDCQRWFNLAAEIVTQCIPQARVIAMTEPR